VRRKSSSLSCAPAAAGGPSKSAAPRLRSGAACLLARLPPSRVNGRRGRQMADWRAILCALRDEAAHSGTSRSAARIPTAVGRRRRRRFTCATRPYRSGVHTRIRRAQRQVVPVSGCQPLGLAATRAQLAWPGCGRPADGRASPSDHTQARRADPKPAAGSPRDNNGPAALIGQSASSINQQAGRPAQAETQHSTAQHKLRPQSCERDEGKRKQQ